MRNPGDADLPLYAVTNNSPRSFGPKAQAPAEQPSDPAVVLDGYERLAEDSGADTEDTSEHDESCPGVVSDGHERVVDEDTYEFVDEDTSERDDESFQRSLMAQWDETLRRPC